MPQGRQQRDRVDDHRQFRRRCPRRHRVAEELPVHQLPPPRAAQRGDLLDLRVRIDDDIHADTLMRQHHPPILMLVPRPPLTGLPGEIRQDHRRRAGDRPRQPHRHISRIADLDLTGVMGAIEAPHVRLRSRVPQGVTGLERHERPRRPHKLAALLQLMLRGLVQTHLQRTPARRRGDLDGGIRGVRPRLPPPRIHLLPRTPRLIQDHHRQRHLASIEPHRLQRPANLRRTGRPDRRHWGIQESDEVVLHPHPISAGSVAADVPPGPVHPDDVDIDLFALRH